jgi:fumarate hydratase subunit beta
MAFKRITLPLSREDARSLKVGDVVVADGEVAVTIGLPTHRRMMACLEEGKPLPLNITGQSLFHISLCYKEGTGSTESLYINPSTSTRFNPFMPTLIRTLGLTAVGGKGGLDHACVEAMREVGCVYLSIVGGASSLTSAAVQAVVESAWDDLIMQFRLTRLRISGLGPLTVGIDAHGDSIYDRLADDARSRMPDILARLSEGRG